MQSCGEGSYSYSLTKYLTFRKIFEYEEVVANDTEFKIKEKKWTVEEKFAHDHCIETKHGADNHSCEQKKLRRVISFLRTNHKN